MSKQKKGYVPYFVDIGMVKKERGIVRGGKGFHGTSNEIVYLFCFVKKKIYVQQPVMIPNQKKNTKLTPLCAGPNVCVPTQPSRALRKEL